MNKCWRWVGPVAVLAVLAGCSKPDDPATQPVVPPGDSPYNNNDPRAKGAPAAPGPDASVPRFGVKPGVGQGKK